MWNGFLGAEAYIDINIFLFYTYEYIFNYIFLYRCISLILQGFWALLDIFYEYIINILFINTLIKYNCTLVIDGEPWFVGKDIAEALGYGKGKSIANAVAKHVDGTDKGVTDLMTPGGIQKMVIINESGLYALIFGSKLESAKRFKRWVTSKVLPAIHKTGGYVSNDNYMIWCSVSCIICYILYCVVVI